MALKQTIVKDIPKDSFRLTRNEAIDFQRTRLSEWKPTSEVFYLNNGPYLLGLASGISSGIILNFFRWKLRLGKTALMSMYAPVTFIPAMSTYMVQEMFVKDSILIQDTCSVCNEIRAFLFQIGFGIVQPTLLGMLLTFSMAKQLYTYPIPNFNPVNPSKYYAFIGKTFKAARGRYGGVLLFSLIASSFVTYKQYSELPTLNDDSRVTYKRPTM